MRKDHSVAIGATAVLVAIVSVVLIAVVGVHDYTPAPAPTPAGRELLSTTNLVSEGFFTGFSQTDDPATSLGGPWSVWNATAYMQEAPSNTIVKGPTYTPHALLGGSTVDSNGQLVAPAGQVYTLANGAAPSGRFFSFTVPFAGGPYDERSNLDQLYTNPYSGAPNFPNASCDAFCQGTNEWERTINVWVPASYTDGSAARILVLADGDESPGSPSSNWGANLSFVASSMEALVDAGRAQPCIIVSIFSGGMIETLLPPPIGTYTGELPLSKITLPGLPVLSVPLQSSTFAPEREDEYGAMSGKYASFVNDVVFPAITLNSEVLAYRPNIQISSNADDRATFGQSSGGAAAMIMGWSRPDLFRRVAGISMSLGVMRPSIAYPHGAWDLHSGLELIRNTAKKNLRVFHTVGEYDVGSYYMPIDVFMGCKETCPPGESPPEPLVPFDQLPTNKLQNTVLKYLRDTLGGYYYGNMPRTKYRDFEHMQWPLAGNRTAQALEDMGYEHKFIYALQAEHCDTSVSQQEMPNILEWLWGDANTVIADWQPGATPATAAPTATPTPAPTYASSGGG